MTLVICSTNWNEECIFYCTEYRITFFHKSAILLVRSHQSLLASIWLLRIKISQWEPLSADAQSDRQSITIESQSARLIPWLHFLTKSWYTKANWQIAFDLIQPPVTRLTSDEHHDRSIKKMEKLYTDFVWYIDGFDQISRSWSFSYSFSILHPWSRPVDFSLWM